MTQDRTSSASTIPTIPAVSQTDEAPRPAEIGQSAPFWRELTMADAVAGCPVHEPQYAERTAALEAEAYERAAADEDRARIRRRNARRAEAARAVSI